MQLSVPTGELPLQAEDIGIVLLPHVGSSPSSDNGRDGQYIADHTGLRVVTPGRPGAGMVFPERGLTEQIRRDYNLVMGRFGEKLAPSLALEGLSKIIIAGRSSGGTAALSLAVSETIPTDAVYAAEPIGWLQRDVKDGKKDYVYYNQAQKNMFDLQPELKNPAKLQGPDKTLSIGDKVMRLVLMVPHALNDRHANKDAWASTICKTNAQTIAADFPELYTAVDIAEYSMSFYGAVHSEPSVLIQQLEALRASASEHAAPFNMEIVPGTTHSSFDIRSFFLDRLKPAIAYVQEKTR